MVYQYTANLLQYYTIQSFIEAFATFGYRVCNNSSYELGFQKIAVYTQPFMGVQHFPSHTARQRVFGGGWLSKLGHSEDIMHPTLECLRDLYGDPTVYMRRSLLVAVTKGHTFTTWRTFRFWLHRTLHPMGS